MRAMRTAILSWSRRVRVLVLSHASAPRQPKRASLTLVISVVVSLLAAGYRSRFFDLPDDLQEALASPATMFRRCVVYIDRFDIPGDK